MNKAEKSWEKYEKFRKLETEFNEIKFKGVTLGSIMANYWGQIYLGIFKKEILKVVLTVFYIYFKHFFNKKKTIDYQKEFIYYKTGSHAHHQKMHEAVIFDNDLKNRSLVIGSFDSGDINKQNIVNIYTLGDILKTFIFFIKNMSHLTKIYKNYKFTRHERFFLHVVLYSTLLKLLTFKKFLKNQKSVKLIGGDYDRGDNTGTFFSVAASLGIKTFTLQHGVINPPFGYSPLIADEIWVWGKMARLQLIKMGVDEKQIKITGTPIVHDLIISKELREHALDKYKLKQGKTIVLALSLPNKYNDMKLVEFLAEIKNIYGTSIDNILVKIHPARNYNDYAWINEDYNIQILPHNISYGDFMNIVDVLLAHNSGIAIEALYYGKKVGILDILDESLGNGLELNKYFNVPLIKSSNDFRKLLTHKKPATSPNMAYYKTGEESKENIANLVRAKLLK